MQMSFDLLRLVQYVVEATNLAVLLAAGVAVAACLVPPVRR
jgi:hypothetical protein